MKKSSLTRAASFALAFAMVCGSVVAVPTDADAANAKKITLSSAKKTMYVGQNFELKVKKVTPAKASKAVTYKSNNTAVATVNKKGKVVAKSEGKATITVTSKKNKKAKAKCVVTVKKAVTNIQTAKKVYLKKGKKLTLNWTVAPTDAPNKKVSFGTSKKSVATVDKKGKITAKKTGKAKITVKSKGGNAKATVNVVVKKKINAVTGITLDKTTLDLDKGASAAVKATVAPANATAKEVYWLSSDQNVATVDANGNITAVADGTATITAYATDYSKKTAAVTVKVTTPKTDETKPDETKKPEDDKKPPVTDEVVEVTSLELDPSAATIKVEDETTIRAVVGPVDATDKDVEWSITNGEAFVEKVSEESNGDGSEILTIKGIAAGTATITAKAGDITKTATVTVAPADAEVPAPVSVEGVDISVKDRDSEEFSLYVGGEATAYANITPADATNKQVVWESDNSDVATVYQVVENGQYCAKIFGKKIGTAKITVTTVDGDYTDTVTVKVMGNAKKEIIKSDEEATNIKFSTDKTYQVALNLGGKETIFTITPEDFQKAYDKYKQFVAVDNIQTFWNKVTTEVADNCVNKLNTYLDKVGVATDIDAVVTVTDKDERTKTVTATRGDYTVVADVAWSTDDEITVNVAESEVTGDAKTVVISDINLEGDSKSAKVAAGGYAVDTKWSETDAKAYYNNQLVTDVTYYDDEVEAYISVPEASEAYSKLKDTFEVPGEFEEYGKYVPATYEELMDTIINSDNLKISYVD